MTIDRVRWVVAALVGLTLFAACTTQSRHREVVPSTIHPVTARPAGAPPPGCGGTPLRRGHVPTWTRTADPPTSLRYAVSDQGNLVGFLFGDPLYAGRVPADAPGNKVLWVARYARDGHPLEVTVSRPGARRARHLELPADSSPGRIYPSGIDVPAPGCWHVVAAWGRHRATLDLPFIATG